MKKEWFFSTVLTVGVFVVAIPYVMYVWKFGFSLSGEQLDWANLGSFLGGVTAPFLAFLSMSLVYTTFKNQVKVQEQNNISSFETSFFSLLNIFHQNELSATFNTIRYNQGRVFKGKSAFDELFADFSQKEMMEIYMQDNDKLRTLLDSKNLYEEFYNSHGLILGHFFRALYNIVNYIDSHEIANRERYINILMSNLNNSQLAFLLFNVNSKHGESKFKPLVKKYNLLENLNYDNKIVLKRVFEAFSE